MKQTQAIICTILSASNTSLWRFLLKGFYRGAGGRGETRRSFRRLEKIWAGEDGKRLFCMVFDAFFLFPGGLWDSSRGALPPMTVCLPVRMGTVSACDWMPVLALRSGWSLHCRTASE